MPDTISDPQRVLHDVFGFSTFLAGQEAAIGRLLQGRSVLTVFPTGGGKSLCYQLPALMFDGLTVVISPLIALMKDQLDALRTRNIPAARLDSSLDREQTLNVYDQLNNGTLKLLYISPERLNNDRFLQSLKRRHISLLAVDEAHCISEWGHNFRPDYLKIAALRDEIKAERVLTLTATATPQVVQDICRTFRIAPDDVVHTGFYRANLHLVVTPSAESERDQLLLKRLAERPKGPTVVYVTLQRTSERVAGVLASHGHKAKAYHAGMKTEDREAVQNDFMASDDMIVVATIAFGMGVDKSNIRAIYHYNLPKGLESYSQEIGRAGRDGQPATCELLASAEDVVVLENFTYGDTPTQEAIDGLLGDVLGQGSPFSVSVYELSGKHDVRPLVVKTLLTYLEIDGIIQSTGPFYTGVRFQPHRPSAEIFAEFNAERADFLRRVFSKAHKGRKWFALDVSTVAKEINESRDRITAAIGYLEEKGDLTVEASGLREGYRLLTRSAELPVLMRSLIDRFSRRERQDVSRVNHVVQFAETPGCLTRFLLNYFGESHDDCGHCSRCRGEAATPLPPPSYEKPRDADVERLRSLQSENHAALQTPRQMTRFLCGLSSPATTRAKLRQHDLYGVFERVPFGEVLDFVKCHLAHQA